MKKLIPFILLLIFSSCEKRYFCVCQYYNEEGVTVLTNEDDIGYYKKRSKDEAEAKCKSMDYQPNGLGDTGRKCELK